MTSVPSLLRSRFAPVILVLAAVGVVVGVQMFGGAGAPVVNRPPIPRGIGSIGTCPLPTMTAMPDWYPKDLPLPEGSFAYSFDIGAGQIRVVSVVVPKGLEETIKLIGPTWAKLGWNLGQGERERFEAENVFWKSDVRYGRFRINTLCSTEWTAVTLALADPAWG